MESDGDAGTYDIVGVYCIGLLDLRAFGSGVLTHLVHSSQGELLAPSGVCMP